TIISPRTITEIWSGPICGMRSSLSGQCNRRSPTAEERADRGLCVMFFELIAAVVAGVAVAGIAMGLRWISRGFLPKWIVPAAAGLGMLSFAIWSEYSWFERNVATQPTGVIVAWNNEQRSFLRPWSYY